MLTILFHVQAEEILHSKALNHEYAPIGGEATYTDAVAKLAFGEDSPVFQNKSNCTVQVRLSYLFCAFWASAQPLFGLWPMASPKGPT